MHPIGNLIGLLALATVLQAQDPPVAVGPTRVEIEGGFESKQAAELAVRTKCLDQWIEAHLRVTAETKDPQKQWLRRLLLAAPEALVTGGTVTVDDLGFNQRRRVAWQGELDSRQLAARWAVAEEFLKHLGAQRAVIQVLVPREADKVEGRPMQADCGAVSLLKQRLQGVGLTIVDKEVAAAQRQKRCEHEQLQPTNASYLHAVKQEDAAPIQLQLGGETTGPHQVRNRGVVTTTWRGRFRVGGVMESSGTTLGSASGTGTGQDEDAALSAAADVAAAQLIDSLFLQWSREAFEGRRVVLAIHLVDGERSKKPMLDALAVVGRSVSTTDPAVDRHRVEAVCTTSLSTHELARLFLAELQQQGVRAELELARWDALRLRIGP